MSPRDNKCYRVLVIDDDPSVLATYRRMLRRAGFDPRAEADPRRVLEEGPCAGDVDLIVIDYKMPGMDGLEFLAEMRRRECTARCILISAFLNDDVRSQARHLGVDHVFDKPVDVFALREAITGLMSRTAGPPATAPASRRIFR